MGTNSSVISILQQKCEELSSYTSEDVRILQWRSNPQFNQFIPKVIFQYQETKQTGIFMSHCHHNQNFRSGFSHQKFIGDLTILKGKLSLEQALFTVKSLLSGYQVLLNYFGKAVVSPKLCFVSKQGQIKSWINEDYRRNTFPSELQGENIWFKQKENLFIKPEEWFNPNKSSSSEGNIIQKVLFLVVGLTRQQQKFRQFLGQIDNFITGNMLQNFNFNQIKRFVNNFIYQKKIFVKSNLLEVLQRLYYQNLQKKKIQPDIRSVFSKEPHIQSKPSHTSTFQEQKQTISFQMSPLILRNQMSPDKRSFIRESIQTKNSQLFSPTAQTITNRSLKLMQSAQNSYFKDEQIYASYCMSQNSGPRSPDSVQVKPIFSKNHISPQYCINFFSTVEKIPQSNKIFVSQMLSHKASVTSSKASNRNSENVDLKIGQYDQRLIPKRKLTEPEEKFNIVNKKMQKEPNNIILDNDQSNNISAGLSFGKRNSRITPCQQKKKLVETNKTSSLSITLKAESNSDLLGTKTVTLLKSKCESSDKQNGKLVLTSQGINTLSQKSSFMENKNQTNQNFFTMKTINRLISSNQNISEQQQSVGDFPSIQNESSYSGILASMGRSVEILNIPEKQKHRFLTYKKPQSIFSADQEQSSPKISIIKSHDGLLKK